MLATAGAQLVSSPTLYTFTANPGKISIKPKPKNQLLALPPEVRNKIYELLFKLEDPIAFLGQTERSHLRANNVKVEKHPEKFRHYLALLQTCRQIHSEAGGVLYGSNDFRLAHAQSVMHDRNLNYILYATARWLTSIESRIPLLRTVVITVNETTESSGAQTMRDHTWHHQYFDILPLVKLYWSDNSGNLQVKFTDSVNYLKMLADQDQEQLYRPVQAGTLHQVLHQIGRDDIWKLKKCRNSLRSILVQRSGFNGYVCYRSTGPRISFRRKFNIHNFGKKLRLFHPQKPTGLTKLPKVLQHNIFRQVVDSEYVEYDTGSSRWLKYEIDLLNVCKSLRKDWEEAMTSRCRFLLSTYARSQSNHFHKAGPFGDAGWQLALREVQQICEKKAIFESRIPFESPISSSFNPPTIMLDLSPATATSLSATTISATHLHQLENFPSHTPITFRLSAPTTQPTHTEESTTTLGELTHRIFLLLSDIYFANLPQTYQLHNIDVHINGHGIPLHAILHLDTDADTDTDKQKLVLPNHRTRTKAPDISKLASGRIARLKNNWITTRFAQSGTKRGSGFVTVLGCFRNMCLRYEERERQDEEERGGGETNVKPCIDDVVDISDFDRVDDQLVYRIRKDREGVGFNAAEFRAVNWRETLCYRCSEGERCYGKIAMSPPLVLRDVPHYGCGGCSRKCVRGTLGPDELLDWRAFKGLPRTSSHWWRH
ncbi:hypothetical protein M3J07_011996 [Ascochyta lentis]